jgi:hypothetical protein
MTTDQPWIKDQDNWQNWDYNRVRSALDGIDVGAVRGYAGNWHSAGRQIAGVLGDFIAELKRTQDGRWSGAAATEAQSVLDGYQSLPGQIQQQSGVVGQLAEHVAGAVAEAKQRLVAPPRQASLVDNVLNGLTSGALTNFGVPDAATVAAQQRAADDQARRLMANIVAPAYNHADRSMPTFPPIRQPGGSSPTPPPPVGGGGGGGTRLGGGSGSTGLPGFSGALPSPTMPAAASDTGPAGTVPGSGYDPAGGGQLGPTGTPPPGSTLTSGFAGAPTGISTDPSGAGAGVGTMGGIGPDGGPGGPSAFGPGSALPGGLPAGGGALGTGSALPGGARSASQRSGGDAFGAAEEAAKEAAQREALAAERSGAMPFGGMAGQRRKDAEDEEHRSPNYVTGPDDLFGYGADGPMVISPVIGEE